ncbi:MAG: FGGY family carbohydrate kinase [Candidatus Hodarchaeota archaeon]
MNTSNNSGHTVGIDVGSSGIRLLLLNTVGNKINDQIVTYQALENQNHHIWDEERRINLGNLTKTVENQLSLLIQGYPQINVSSLSISGIGPSLVLLSKQAQPLIYALTYAYQGAQDYVNYLPTDFQKRTGSLHSGALPYVQLLKLKYDDVDDILKSCFKITTINDYLTWNMTDLQLKDIFSSIPNASYTGLYSLETRDWDKKLLHNMELSSSILPKIVPLGTVFPLKNTLKQLSNVFKNTCVIAGAIDGIDAFWATGVESEDIIVGSASSTGALRRLRKTPKTNYNSRLIQCCQIKEGMWVELIPFNNVGTSFNWLANNFNLLFQNYVTREKRLKIGRLEREATSKLEDEVEGLKSFFLKLPLYFPYIEGEPRGPNGRGRVKGGFIFQKGYGHDCIDLYLSLLIGIVNMYQHNLEVLDPPDTIQEIRITGLIAQKSRLFLRLLASLTNKNIVIMKTDQSIAWATGMRALTYVNIIDRIPKVSVQDPILPENREIQKCLRFLYKRYMEVYNAPFNYQIIYSEKEIDQ